MTDSSWPTDKVIDASISINASPSKVLATLTDFNSYPTWSKFITSVEPQDDSKSATVGSTLKINLLPPGGSAMSMTPTVVKNDEDGFGWHGHLMNMNGIFDGKHLFLVSEEGEGKTKLVQREEFGGFLFTPLMKWMGMEAKTRAGFVEFNEAVKKRVEES